MSERDVIAEIRAERAAKEAKRAEDWPKALDKLYITFEASHGGGYPQCLAALGSEEERLRYLRELGGVNRSLAAQNFRPFHERYRAFIQQRFLQTRGEKFLIVLQPV